MMQDEEHQLWTVTRGGDVVACVMITCCAGAELQVRRGGEIILRELYPSKADLYERARILRDEYARHT